MTYEKKNQKPTARMSNLRAETDAQRQISRLKNDLSRQKKIAEKYKRKSSQVETSGKRQRLG